MRLKKVMATGLVAALALSTMVGCSSKKDSSDQKKIGVVQLVEHDALDAYFFISMQKRMKDFPNSFILFLLSISSIAVLLRLLSSHSLLQSGTILRRRKI